MKRPALSQSVKTKLALAREAELAGQFVALCQRFGIPRPELQYRFHPNRRWKVDFAWDILTETPPNQPWQSETYEHTRIALEVDGGVWSCGKHGRGSGIVKDMEKQNALALAGYLVFRVQPDDLCNYATIRMIGQALGITVPPLGSIR